MSACHPPWGCPDNSSESAYAKVSFPSVKNTQCHLLSFLIFSPIPEIESSKLCSILHFNYHPHSLTDFTDSISTNVFASASVCFFSIRVIILFRLFFSFHLNYCTSLLLISTPTPHPSISFISWAITQAPARPSSSLRIFTVFSEKGKGSP